MKCIMTFGNWAPLVHQSFMSFKKAKEKQVLKTKKCLQREAELSL